MPKKEKARPGEGLLAPGEVGAVEVAKREGENIGRTLARLTLDPQTRHANLAIAFGGQVFGDKHRPDMMESSAVLGEEIQRAMRGELSLATRILVAQAITLDAMFTEMAGRSGKNLGHYPDAADRYMRLALKSQSACRSTLEALTKLHQPREQTVKHVHVNDGGQAVVADHFHQHLGGRENVEKGEQCHATGAAGAGAALPSPDPLGNGVPIASREGKAALSDARRDKSRRT